MSNILFKDDKIIFRDGQIVFVDDPALCECCSLPPTNCRTNEYSGCWKDLHDSIGNDWMALYAYVSGFQFDVEFSGVTGTRCNGAACQMNATWTLPHYFGFQWLKFDTPGCTEGVNNYNRRISVSMGCANPAVYEHCVIAVEAELRNPITSNNSIGHFRLTFADMMNWNGISNLDIPFYAAGGSFSEAVCKWSFATCRLSLH